MSVNQENNASSGVKDFSQTAQNTAQRVSQGTRYVKARKLGKSAADAKAAASKATAAIKFKVYVIALLIFYGFALLAGILSLFPMSISNPSLYQSDPENLSASGTFGSGLHETAEEDIDVMMGRYNEAKAKFDATVQTAASAAQSAIEANARSNGWVVDSVTGVQGGDLRDFHYLTFLAAYSAAAANGFSDEMYIHFMDTSAIQEIDSRLHAIMQLPNNYYPFGNMIVGASYANEWTEVVTATETIPAQSIPDYQAAIEIAAGGASDSMTVTIEPVDSGSESTATESGGDGDGSSGGVGMATVTYSYEVHHVSVELWMSSIDDISVKAFGIDMMAPYQEDGILNDGVTVYSTKPETSEDTDADAVSGSENAPGTVDLPSYGDIIDEMVHTMGTTLFGEDFWESVAFMSGRFSFGSAASVIGVAENEYDAHLDSEKNPLSWDGDKYFSILNITPDEYYPWDAAFVCWCVQEAGYEMPDTMRPFAVAKNGIAWFQGHEGRWKSAEELLSYSPMAGDILFTDTGEDGIADRVDFIISSDAGAYNIIGGDREHNGESHTISRGRISSSDPSIVGIGRPIYNISFNYYGIDCAENITDRSAKALVQNGFTFVARYVGPFDWGKCIKQPEMDLLIENGLAVMLCYEADASSAKGGYYTGLTHGFSAAKYANLLGVPAGTTIYFAIDYDAPASDYPMLLEYFRGVTENIGDYTVGAYGGYRTVEYLYNSHACDRFWQCVAWSYGQVSGRINAYQYQWSGASESKQTASAVGLWAVDMDASNDLVGAGMYMP